MAPTFSQMKHINLVEIFRVDERLIKQVIKSTLFSFKKSDRNI